MQNKHVSLIIEGEEAQYRMLRRKQMEWSYHTWTVTKHKCSDNCGVFLMMVGNVIVKNRDMLLWCNLQHSQ